MIYHVDFFFLALNHIQNMNILKDIYIYTFTKIITRSMNELTLDLINIYFLLILNRLNS